MPIEELLFKDKPLASVSTLGIGGPARFFLEVKNIPDLEEAFAWAKKEKMPVFILGRGSNSLFDDRGFDGLVIQNRIDFCENTAGKVVVGAGYNFSLLGVQTARQGYSGLEFASGIPGTVGGAVFMNAGANGGETFDCLKEVLFFDAETMQKNAPPIRRYGATSTSLYYLFVGESVCRTHDTATQTNPGAIVCKDQPVRQGSKA